METTKFPSIDDWIKEMWHVYAVESYSAIRKDETLPFVTTWVHLDNIMLSEMSDRKS